MNPLLRLRVRDDFVAALRAGRQPKPANMDSIVAANIHGVRPSSRTTVDELATALARADAPLVVDVRFPAEYGALHLEPSVSIPLDEIARRRTELPHDRELVLVCRTGARARLAEAQLAGYRTRVLEGGLVAWREAGHPVVEGKAHMSLERQVRVAAGTLACLGGVLAVAVSPWFGLVPAFIGAGLVYAGITDRCGMAMMLARLPYNRRRGEASPAGTCAAQIVAGTCAAPIANVPSVEEPDRQPR
jgi:rhodanese-related sulfurtransferase